jgi:hypothetical protein
MAVVHGGAEGMPAKTTSQQPDAPWLADVEPMLDRAQKGDTSVLPELRAWLDSHPDIWKQAGDLALHAQECLLNLVAGQDLFARESILRKLSEIKLELAPSSCLEKLLADRIALCWLAVHYAEYDAVQARQNGNNPTLAEHARKRLDSAHRRYLDSIKQLAVVRKLLKPAVSPLQLLNAGVKESPGKATSQLGSRQGMALNLVGN